ncbi:MAG TPA: transposase [Candidatus Saccharicenans sp.]|nr:transposase [Candidatus Saccharicenans sp.]HPB59965.1 transposase [Candidatus Saccharicenans sp.]HQO76249.1 transposase [Candidatus Saccharicenans sp.]HUM79524.1 transposase [Candidatus Saccharicenans sp.]
MPRAKRFFLPGYIWHITNRCVNKEFLLNDDYYKQRVVRWMSDAIGRYKICILNYAITSNHIHLLLLDEDQGCSGGLDKPGRPAHSIPQAMRLILGRVAQEYNVGQKRVGPLWQDRYHATAIESGYHLLNCMVYIDLNMVRAGVVRHPEHYLYCGYQEIVRRNKALKVINRERLAAAIGVTSDNLSEAYRQSVDDILDRKGKALTRDEKWTASLAVGNYQFVETFKIKSGIKTFKRHILDEEDAFVLRDNLARYG